MPTARSDKFGAVVVPAATAGAGVSLAAKCDPAIVGLLADFKAVINTKLAAAWTAAAGLTMPANPVVDTFEQEPTPDAINRTWNGPALFMWRSAEKVLRRTNVFEEVEATVKVLYVLPPMPWELAVKLSSIRTAVRTVLLGYVYYKGDPTQKDKTLLSTYNIDSFTWTDARYGSFPGLDEALGQDFLVLEMTAAMRERQTWVLTQYATLTRIDAEIDSNDNSGGSTKVSDSQFTP